MSGWSDFSAKTEENEEKLFGLVKKMTSRLQSTDDKKGEKLFLQMIISGDAKTYLVRQLEKRAMKNSYDMRGSRRLAAMCDFISKVGLKTNQKFRRKVR